MEEVEEEKERRAIDGADWWTGAMNDLARRSGGPVTAADMLALCSSGAFDAAFVAFATRALGVAPARAAERVREEASRQLPLLRRVAVAEAKAVENKSELDIIGVPLARLWVCGYCGNSNPQCPYRATKSGGFFIYVPMDMATGALCQQGVADLDVKAAAGFSNFQG